MHDAYTHTHIHTQLWESIKPTEETNRGSIYQAEEEEGVDGGNNTQHAPLCLTGLIGAQEDMGGIVAKAFLFPFHTHAVSQFVRTIPGFKLRRSKRSRLVTSDLGRQRCDCRAAAITRILSCIPLVIPPCLTQL